MPTAFSALPAAGALTGAEIVPLVQSGANVQSTATAVAALAAVASQPLDADLTTIAGLTATTDNFMQAKSSAWASRTVAQVRPIYRPPA